MTGPEAIFLLIVVFVLPAVFLFLLFRIMWRLGSKK